MSEEQHKYGGLDDAKTRARPMEKDHLRTPMDQILDTMRNMSETETGFGNNVLEFVGISVDLLDKDIMELERIIEMKQGTLARLHQQQEALIQALKHGEVPVPRNR